MSAHPSDDACCPTSSPTPPGPAAAQRSQTPRPAVVAPSSPQPEAQEAWAWASDELKQKIRTVCRDEACAAEPSPARRFGAGIGALGLGDKLGLNPHREIEKLNDRVEALETRPKRQRRKSRVGGRGKDKDNDYWLDRWEKDVCHEVRADGHKEDEFFEQMGERVYSLSSVPAAQAINDRYRKMNKGKNVVSASSLRRRHPAWITKNARGDEEKVLGAFKSKRWAQWEPHRRRAELEDELADGSIKPRMEGEDVKDQTPRPMGGALGPLAATPEEDSRKRSLGDSGKSGGLQTATRRDLAEAAIAKGELVKHEGGQGLCHFREPTNEREAREDLEEQMANKYFREIGLDPHAVHKKVKSGRAAAAD